MARIYQRAGKKGAVWYLDYVVEGRRVRKRIGKSKRLAVLALADTEVKLERREIGFAPTDKKLSDLSEEYRRHIRSNGTRDSAAITDLVLDRFRDFVGTDRLRNLTHLHIEKYKSWRREAGAMASSVNRELAVIKAMLNRGVEWGFLAKSPAVAVRKLKEPKRQARFFSAAEVTRILEAADDTIRPIALFLLNTGLRREELLRLTWGDIDLDHKLVTVQAKDGWRPKDYEVRHIPLNEAALSVLRDRSGSGDPRDWVFRGRAADPYDADFLTHRFKALLRQLKIEGSLHTLRHTFASHLTMKGTDLYTVSKLLGHSSVKTTEIYAHLAPDYLRSAVARLSFEKVSDGASRVADAGRVRRLAASVPTLAGPDR